jgi:glycosyltransferase involved in cell wall biosynthesis
MKIAVDKNSISVVKKNNNEYIYLFDKESLDELLSKDLHCIYYKNCDYVDINLTDYNVNCLKKAKITDEDYDLLPDKIDYKFAIIVPNCNNDRGDYKGKTFLRNCIESILNQTYDKFELIIIDDCSTDTSIETVKEYQKKDKRIHLIENKRKKYNGGSRNVGIDYALENLNFDYFAFLDSDDFYTTNKALETINDRLYGHDMALLGMQLVDKNGVFMTKFHEYNNYEDFFLSDNKVWCTAWARVIKKNKIAYFCESTLMEDRVWSYRQADQIDDLDKVVNIKETLYTWNRTNTTNSVSLVRNYYWDASAWCHIGHQLQLIGELRHKEMIPILEKRVKTCIEKANKGVYQQY